jgi:RNA-directed DNA polymerase
MGFNSAASGGLSRSRAEEAQRRVERILLALGLRLHVGKTSIIHLTHGEEGFDFLGFHHRKVESWKRQGFYTCRSGRPIATWP